MQNNKWKKLQNGSDIRGFALDGVEGQPVNLTDDVVKSIGSSFALWLSNKKEKPIEELRVGVGRDSRLSGPRLKEAVIKGITHCGCCVYDCGLASTPAMFMTTVTEGYEYDGAVMITASHLPFNRNGLKFFIREGGLEKQDIIDILRIAEENHFPASSVPGTVKAVDFISVYAAGLADKVRKEVNHPSNYQKPLTRFKIVVDAGNGAAGFFAEKVLVPLGADITGSQFLEPDGAFPNHIPNPEDEEAMESITKAVLTHHADLGIIFDADGDRAGAVDQNGKELNRNRLVALMSAIVLEEHPGSTIVTDSITSSGLKIFIEEKLKGSHHRFKRGYKNVINEAIRLNKEGRECHLAIETSGHGALKENYFLDDGAYLVTKILVKMAQLRIKEGKTIDILIDDLAEPVESKEFRMDIKVESFREYGEKILTALAEYAAHQAGWKVAADNHEGIRVSFEKGDGDGWFLLRMSLHDPLMPLNIESDTAGGVLKIVGKLFSFLESYDALNSSPLKDFVQG